MDLSGPRLETTRVKVKGADKNSSASPLGSTLLLGWVDWLALGLEER